MTLVETSRQIRVGMDCCVCVRFVYVFGEAGNENRCILKMAIIAFFFVLGKTILKKFDFALDHKKIMTQSTILSGD